MTLYSIVRAGAAKGERFGPGYCYLEKFRGNGLEAVKLLGKWPSVGDFLAQRDAERKEREEEEDDEFSGWTSFLPGEKKQVVCFWDNDDGGLSVVASGDGVYHVFVDPTQTKSLLSQLRSLDFNAVVGSLISDVVAAGATAKDEALDFLTDVLGKTNALIEDAADNYHQLGNSMEDLIEKGGVKKIARSNFVEIVKGIVGRWASPREAKAAANVAAATLYSDTEWSPCLFEEAMEGDYDEETRQAKLMTMASMYMVRNVQVHWSQWLLRRKFAAWRSDILGPAKTFARAFGMTNEQVDKAIERAVDVGHPFLMNAIDTLRESAIPAITVMSQVAAGAVVAAGLIVSAGVILDWYYVDKELQRLGPVRETIGERYTFDRIVERAQEYYAVSAVLSDEAYDVKDHTHVVKLDPFYFSIKKEIELLKDDTAASRLVSNTFLTPLINTATSTSKNFLLLPASVSQETAKHFQNALPFFYFRIVNRMHSHPELWAARRAFELVVARALVADKMQDPVVMIGANVRQVSKMPRVAKNFGPILSGRDEARHSLGGTSKQRSFYAQKTDPVRFAYDTVNSRFRNGIAVSFFSTQDLCKQDFIETCIKSGISRAYVAMNIPIVMMDERITEWEDTVMNVRYTKRGDGLSMAILGMPVAGYDNSYWRTMSWVKPHRPVDGYDVTMEAIAQVGSSYLFYLQIGAGPQEGHDTLWKMPDAGHYVLTDLTREADQLRYFTVPQDKFDQVVKYVVQLNGAKNLFESTTGRILGLEAAIRIGGVTLDKSWRLGHREFVSVAVHAISCAGVDKTDALIMIGKMREFFSERTARGWWSSAKNGYRKLFNLEGDSRIPGLAARGRHDYEVVTHWTCRQKPGKGFGQRFAQDKPPPPPDDVSDSSSGDEGRDSSECDEVSTDESDVEADALNSDDAGGADKKPGSGFFDFVTSWRTPKSVDDVKKDIGDVSTSMRLVLPADVGEDYTSSNFNPSGGVSFVNAPNESRSNKAFVSAFGSMSDVRQALAGGGEFPAPDAGAVSICEEALKVVRQDLTLGQTTLNRPVDNYGNDAMGIIQRNFFQSFDENALRVPSILLDGLAGSAKSTVLRMLVREMKKTAVTVVPSRKLAGDWRAHKVGVAVTRHGLRESTLAGRELLIIDEVYAYTKAELAAYLSMAARRNVSVIALGDRKQQYEDGAEITVEDLRVLGIPIMRMLVSNTMPLDALHVLKWASSGDEFESLFQTRNVVRHSIFFVGPDHVSTDWIGRENYKNTLVYKDRLGPRLGWKKTDEEMGFDPEKQEEWLSISRVQGSRSEFTYLLCTSTTKAERWFANQRGMFYVATSRHSKGMVVSCYQHDLGELSGLQFENWTKVDGRMTKLTPKEKFDAPLNAYQSTRLKSSPILDMMYQRGILPQMGKIASLGPIKEDWRPWPKASSIDGARAVAGASFELKTLIGSEKPYAETDAVKYPVFQSAMGLWSLRRPVFVEPEPIRSVFEGMNRLAVNQTSKDEVLDLKNVVERTARPRKIEHDEQYIKSEGERLFGEVIRSFFDESKACDFSTGPMATDWAEGRTSDFVRKYLLSDPFGLTSASVRSYGFLKTQVKVKVKRQFAMEENYGQTVLASPADYNAQMGPWSKTFLRNVRLACRDGVFLDSGYSDSDLARGLRNCGAFSRFMDENYQADVRRQDTSHTPVTLRVFRLALEYFGVPGDLAELYEKQSTYYRYRSLHSGLYDGQAENNLGSGDPFTLIRNIFEVLTVMVERFGSQELSSATLIVKGDDYICDKISPLLPVSVPEVRATQLTEDFNKPPYHAGRFLLEASLVPDPIRMVCKAVVKPAKDMDRVNELAEAFYDRYISLSESDYRYLKEAIRVAYCEFDPALLDSIFDLYMAMRDRNVFYNLVQPDHVVGTRLSVEQSDTDCAAYAVSFFTEDQGLIEAVRNEGASDIERLCVLHNIPVFRMLGRANDLKKRGVWLSDAHAWAVVEL